MAAATGSEDTAQGKPREREAGGRRREQQAGELLAMLGLPSGHVPLTTILLLGIFQRHSPWAPSGAPTVPDAALLQ